MGNMATWTSYTPQKRILTSNTNTTTLLIHKRSLVFLRVSPNQQGNYSCSLGNNTFWSRLVVLSAVSYVNHEGAQYTTTCYTQESCTLWCPSSNTPGSDTPNMTQHGITWTKGGGTLFKDVFFFPRVEETDEGTYTCTRSYRYKGQTYNMTFINKLSVKHHEPRPDVQIISPQNSKVFEIELGCVFVVNCTATISSDFDEAFWMTDASFVNTDTNLRVFSNSTIFANAKEKRMTTLLIFKEVLEEDLSKNFTCKLESVLVMSSFVTITLEQKRKQETALLPILIIMAMLLLTAVAALTCVKSNYGVLLQDSCHTRSVAPPTATTNQIRETFY
ncbi:interleukin-1 receptor accessory protein-like [Eucyclogobius newberryi]|uniref:interleukin-1 receptor accessory protein-like n=1 Tax=Eucyclogobius newberryi TaxID=166745 RepID=UPI003B5A89F0